MISVSIESEQVITRQSKKNVPYYKQTAWVFLTDRDGVTDPHPSKITFMVSKDQAGNPIPEKKGRYSVHPSSFRVGQFGDLEIGFLNLQPIKQPVKSAS